MTAAACMPVENHSTAVILPCHNESVAIAGTIAEFKAALPGAIIVVCDNASSDDTAGQAREAGAAVIHQGFRGKGNAVRRLFAEVDADIFVMADGDGTYDAASAAALIETLIARRLDMVIGLRQGTNDGQYRRGHVVANRLYSWLFSRLFKVQVDDLFSGYRVMSRRFVKTFPCYSSGFEIETELNSHAAVHKLPIAEIPTFYFARPEGSASKLNKVRDGARILTFFAIFLRDYAPMRMFAAIAIVLALLSIALFIPVGLEFLETHQVPALPDPHLKPDPVLAGLSQPGRRFRHAIDRRRPSPGLHDRLSRSRPDQSDTTGRQCLISC